MSARLPMYEVVVMVKDSQVQGHYSSFLGMYCYGEMPKMKHIEARTPNQAKEKAKKYGRPLSIRLHQTVRRFENIENLKLNQQPIDDIYQHGNPYSDAIAMDEMIWKKRNDRRKNMKRDKKYL
jgi:ribosomal protein S16